MLSCAKPGLEQQQILALPPCLWQLMWHMPSPLSAGRQSGSEVFTDSRANSMGQLPAAIYRSVISYFWLLPKKTSTADLYQHSKNAL